MNLYVYGARYKITFTKIGRFQLAGDVIIMEDSRPDTRAILLNELIYLD